jgi:hypothetical protein
VTIKRPQILAREGKPAFAVLPIEDYQALRARLQDLEDLALLREAQAADANAPADRWRKCCATWAWTRNPQSADPANGTEPAAPLLRPQPRGNVARQAFLPCSHLMS